MILTTGMIWLIVLTSPFWFCIVIVLLGLIYELIKLIAITIGMLIIAFLSLFERKK